MFCQKLPIRTAYHTFLESKHPEVTKNLYYVLSTCRSQSVIFRLQLMDFYYFFRFQRGEGQLKGRTVIGGFVVFELVVALRITKLHTHYITFSGIWNFLLRWTLICKILLFVKWKTHRFVFYLSCRTITVISKILLFLWNSQGDFAINSCINWWKSLAFTWTKTSMKNASTKANLFTHRFSWLERLLKISWRYRPLLNV